MLLDVSQHFNSCILYVACTVFIICCLVLRVPSSNLVKNSRPTLHNFRKLWTSCGKTFQWIRPVVLIVQLSVMHENHLTHTDLKPENMLFIDDSYEMVKSSRHKVGPWPFCVACACIFYKPLKAIVPIWQKLDNFFL